MRVFLIFCCLFFLSKSYSITWSATGTTIYNGSSEDNTLHVDIDSTGDGFAAWNQKIHFIRQIQCSNETSGNWSDPDLINYYLRNLRVSDISVKSNINGLLVGIDSTDVDTIYAFPIASSSIVPPSVNLSGGILPGYQAKVSTSSNGDSIAAWTMHSGSYTMIYGAVYSSSSWSSSVLLSETGQNANNPSISIDSSGNAVVVWSRFDGSNFRVQAIRYNASTWSSVDTLSNAGADGIFPSIAVNSSGDAIVVWAEYTALQALHIYSCTLDSGVWSSPTLVSAPSYISQFPNVVIDSYGDGCAIWTENDGTTNRIKSSIYSAPGVTGATGPTGADGWQTPSYVSDANKTAYKGKLASDDAGNIVCVWKGLEGTTGTAANPKVYVATYEGFWSSPELISDPTTYVNDYDLGINELGDAIIAWESGTSSSNSIIEVKKASF